ncbi:hypothetical protein CYMTET_11767 [Cymbomonas tetramitiformis]|uniref:F5/8 type C domain-containing protein n=1 Tax=Cymbomonas tetramitiformis TaxID=36881 RepID=A0AAE0LCU1_9CHLO|nr:hypothetical protein CYMTET_11767 [Cymbomonas tetramitiformis]
MADEVVILPRSRDLLTPSRLGGSELFGASSGDGIMFHISASRKVKVYWSEDDARYTGTVCVPGTDGLTHIAYEDGDEEDLDMNKEKYEANNMQPYLSAINIYHGVMGITGPAKGRAVSRAVKGMSGLQVQAADAAGEEQTVRTWLPARHVSAVHEHRLGREPVGRDTNNSLPYNRITSNIGANKITNNASSECRSHCGTHHREMTAEAMGLYEAEAIVFRQGTEMTFGEVYTVGGNAYGQLGDGSGTNQSHPVLVAISGNVVQVAAWDHTVFRTSLGQVLACGSNAYGQLGLGSGNTTDIASPVRVMVNFTVTHIAAGHFHTLFVTSGADVYGAGRNSEGQLGTGGTSVTHSSAPLKIPVSSASGVVHAAAGRYHSVFVLATGKGYATGYNSAGQLGDGTRTARTSVVEVALSASGAQVVAGCYHTVILTADGQTYMTGKNDYGQLGDGSTTWRSTPVRVMSSHAVKEAAAGWHHTLFLTTDGTAYATGRRWTQQQSDRYHVLYPDGQSSTPVQVMSGQTVTQIAAGGWHSLFVTAASHVYSGGRNSEGQLGDGTRLVRIDAAEVPILTTHAVGGIGAGRLHSVFMAAGIFPATTLPTATSSPVTSAPATGYPTVSPSSVSPTAGPSQTPTSGPTLSSDAPTSSTTLAPTSGSSVALGMQSGAIADSQISASSEHRDCLAASGRLASSGTYSSSAGSQGAWCAASSASGEWLQVDLGSSQTVQGISTQGRHDAAHWVTSYQVQGSIDGVTWTDALEQVTGGRNFTGNSDQTTTVFRRFFTEIAARYLRVYPLAWSSYIAMRVELYSYMYIAPAPSPPPPPPPSPPPSPPSPPPGPLQSYQTPDSSGTCDSYGMGFRMPPSGHTFWTDVSYSYNSAADGVTSMPLTYTWTLADLAYGSGVYVATAQTAYGVGSSNEWPASSAFDHQRGASNFRTGYHTLARSDQKLTLQMPTAIQLSSYTISQRFDCGCARDQSPSTWTRQSYKRIRDFPVCSKHDTNAFTTTALSTDATTTSAATDCATAAISPITPSPFPAPSPSPPSPSSSPHVLHHPHLSFANPIPSPPRPQPPPPSGASLVMYYAFDSVMDNIVYDIGGAYQHGRTCGSAWVPVFTSGYSGRALYLNASTSGFDIHEGVYVDAYSTSASSKFEGAMLGSNHLHLTVDFYFNLELLGHPDGEALLNFAAASTTGLDRDGLSVWLDSASTLWLRRSDEFGVESGDDLLLSASVSYGSWHHIVISTTSLFDMGTTVEVWLDGRQCVAATFSEAARVCDRLPIFNAHWWLSGRRSSSRLKMKLDEVRIYSNSSTPPPPSPPPPSPYFPSTRFVCPFACGTATGAVYWSLALAKGSYGAVDIGEDALDALFTASTAGIVKRLCSSCATSHREIYYKRLPRRAPISWHGYLASNWSSTANILNVDFELYSTHADALAGANRWTYCNYYSAQGVGFPGECGAAGAVTGQWNTWAPAAGGGAGQDDVAFYVQIDCPCAISTCACKTCTSIRFGDVDPACMEYTQSYCATYSGSDAGCSNFTGRVQRTMTVGTAGGVLNTDTPELLRGRKVVVTIPPNAVSTMTSLTIRELRADEVAAASQHLMTSRWYRAVLSDYISLVPHGSMFAGARSRRCSALSWP